MYVEIIYQDVLLCRLC